MPTMAVVSISRLTALVLLVLCVSETGAVVTKNCASMIMRPHPRGLCGSASVAGTILSLCRGPAGKKRKKRDSEDVLGEITLDKENAMTYLTKRQYNSITCECCFHMCTIAELLDYCP